MATSEEEKDKFSEIVMRFEKATESRLVVTPICNGCGPNDIRYAVVKNGRPICYTRDMEDANYVMASIKGAAKFCAITLGAMLCGARGNNSNKPEGVPHGV